MTRLIALAALSFGITSGLVPLMRGIARRRGWLIARPVADRWHHRQPISKVGGLAMFAALVPLAWLTSGAPALNRLLLLSTLMFGVGLVDDLRHIRPVTKLAAQTAAAVLFLSLAPTLRISGSVWVDLVFSVLWIVSITNAFNLLDNIDGLAAGLAAIAGVFALAGPIGASAADLTIASGVAAMVGAAAGFLVYNWQPASVFMGDSGSHLLGSFIAGATLLWAPSQANLIEPAGAVGVLLLVPVADTVVVTITRRLAGRSPFAGGIDHVSHRLVALGLTDRRAVLTLYTLTIAGGLVALALGRLPPAPAWTLVAMYVTSIAGAGVYVGRVKIEGRPLVSQDPGGRAREVRASPAI